MKKFQWPELIQIELGGGSATIDIKEKYRAGIIQYWVGIAFDDMIVRVFQNSDNYSVSDLDAYGKFYGNRVLQTSDETGKIYVILPTTVKRLLQIPNNKAIRRIMTVGENTPRKCLYRDQGMSDVYSQLEADTVLTNPRWDLIGSRIYFDSKILSATAVDILMVVPYSEWDDEDDLPAPLENNQIIIDYVVGKLRQLPPEDKIMDDNAVQT